MLKQCNKLLILSILLLSHDINAVQYATSTLDQYISERKESYNDFGTGITSSKISDIMLTVLDHNVDYDTVGHVITPNEIPQNSPYLLEILIKRALFNFVEKKISSQSISYFMHFDFIKNKKIMEESYQLALNQIMPTFKNTKIAFDKQSSDKLLQLLLQPAVISYFKSDINLMSEISKRKIVSKADVHTFLKYCFPRLYQSHVDIRERKDWEGPLMDQNAWDKSMPQLFEVTIGQESYVVKASWRAFEYENSRKVYDLLEKDGKTYNRNGLVSYPTKFALYNAKSSAVEIFIDLASSTNILTEKALAEKFFKNNFACAIRDEQIDRYRFLKGILPKKVIFQIMPTAKGNSVLWYLDDCPQKSPQLSHKVGEKCGDALMALHGISYDKGKKCTTSLHGDFHMGNFIYDSTKDTISIIDLGLERQMPEASKFAYPISENDFYRLLCNCTNIFLSNKQHICLYELLPSNNNVMFVEGLLSQYQKKIRSCFSAFST